MGGNTSKEKCSTASVSLNNVAEVRSETEHERSVLPRELHTKVEQKWRELVCSRNALRNLIETEQEWERERQFKLPLLRHIVPSSDTKSTSCNATVHHKNSRFAVKKEEDEQITDNDIHEMVNDSMQGHMKRRQVIFVKERIKTVMIGGAVKFNTLDVDNLDDSGSRIRQLHHQYPEHIQDERQRQNKQDFEYKDEATAIPININQNESTLSPNNLENNIDKEHAISSDQSREAPGLQSTPWKMFVRLLTMLGAILAVHILSHHHILVTSIVGLFFIQMFANNIYRVFVCGNNDETINYNISADLVRRALGFLVPVMLIQLQLAAVVIWQFHETHLAHEPQLNQLPSFVVLGLMTFHVLLQFTFHVIDFTRLLM